MKIFLSVATPKNPTTEPPIPIIIAPLTSTNPAAGVIATRPATTPEAAPKRVGFLNTVHSITNQVTAATAVATVVVRAAKPAIVLAPNADPALNPYHPNHSNAAPSAVSITLIGFIAIIG